MKKVTKLLALFGLVCLIYLATGFSVWKWVEIDDFGCNGDEICYWESDWQAEIRWIKGGRGATLHRIDHDRYRKMCPQYGNMIKDYWFYQLECKT